MMTKGWQLFFTIAYFITIIIGIVCCHLMKKIYPESIGIYRAYVFVIILLLGIGFYSAKAFIFQAL